MKKLILSSVVGLALAFNVFAEGNVFNGNELSVSLGTGYDGVNSSFSQQYDFNLEGGADYFVTKNFGLNVSVPFYAKDGFEFEEVRAGAVVRVPAGRVAPYAGANAVYNWDQARTQYLGRAGLEARLNDGWGLFGEAWYQINSFNSSDAEHGVWSLVGGVRLVLF